MKVAVFVACFVAGSLVAGVPYHQKNPYKSSAAYNPYTSYKSDDYSGGSNYKSDYKEKPYNDYSSSSKYDNDGYKSGYSNYKSDYSNYKSDYSNKNYDYNNDYQSYDNYRGYDNYASDYNSNDYGYDKNYDSQYQSDYGYQKGCPSLESLHVIRPKYTPNNFVKYIGDTKSITAFCGPPSSTTVASFYVKCHDICVKINERGPGLEEFLSFSCKNNKWVLLAGSEDFIPVSSYSITCGLSEDETVINGCTNAPTDLVACL